MHARSPLLATIAGVACLCAAAFACARTASTPIDPVPAAASSVTDTSTRSRSNDEPSPCIEVDPVAGGSRVDLEGRIVIDEAFEHPSRGRTRPFILRLESPRCAVGVDPPRVSEVHLAPTDAIGLKPLVGKRVRVSGDPFHAHTAWHARQVVLMTTSATPLR